MTATTTNKTAFVQPTKPQRRLGTLLRRGLLGLVAVAAGLSGLGAVYEAWAERADARAYPPPGQMVMVDGRRIHLQIAGNASGQPTVLLEAGIASFSSNWAWVQEELAASTRVVAYDRAGLGWSDPSPEPHDAFQSARDLHAALQAAGIAGPYVVVGHSYGALVVRAFTDLYPAEVVGMVLADGSHPDQFVDIAGPNGARTVSIGNFVTGVLARLGAIRLLNMSAAITAGLPERAAAEMTANLARPQPWTVSSRVIALWGTHSRDQVNQAHDLGALPLIVLSATDRPNYGRDAMEAQQAKLAALSSNSRHLQVDGASHEGIVAQPEYAEMVVNAIQRVIEAAQTGTPLN